jgi:hypothetical protein
MRHAIAKSTSEDHPGSFAPIEPHATGCSSSLSGVVPLRTGCDSGLCRIQAMSDEGIKLLTSVLLEPEDPVTLSLSPGVTLSGIVVWVEQFRVGIRFDESINSAALLQSLDGAQQVAGHSK